MSVGTLSRDVVVSVSDVDFYDKLMREWQSTIYHNWFLDDGGIISYIRTFINNLFSSVSSLFSSPRFVFVYDGLNGEILRLVQDKPDQVVSLESFLSSLGFTVKRRGIITGLHDMKIEIYENSDHLCDFYLDVREN